MATFENCIITNPVFFLLFRPKYARSAQKNKSTKILNQKKRRNLTMKLKCSTIKQKK